MRDDSADPIPLSEQARYHLGLDPETPTRDDFPASGSRAERPMPAEEERDLLARQRDAVLEYCRRVDANGGGGYVRSDVIYQLVITDPADDDKPRYSDVDVAIVDGMIQLIGDGGTLIAELPGDRAAILAFGLTEAVGDASWHLRRARRLARIGIGLAIAGLCCAAATLVYVLVAL
jgi:hypothetical protein